MRMAQSFHPVAQQGFRLSAVSYQQSRPNYPQDVVFWLRNHLNLHQNAQVIDLTAGTGKFTHYLKKITPHITAIEPALQMQLQFKKQYPQLPIIEALSHQIPLQSQCYDAILSAQAFHWFAHQETLQEAHRLLKPQGNLGLIWNERDLSVDWVKAITELLLPFERNTPRFRHQTWKNAFQYQPYFKLESEQHFPYVHHGDVKEVVVQRLLSSSFTQITTNGIKKTYRTSYF